MNLERNKANKRYNVINSKIPGPKISPETYV